MWSIGHRWAGLDPMRSANAAMPSDADPAAAYDALRTWLAARDAVLRGLVHALSNRVGTVIAAGGLLDAGSAEVAARVLGSEADRLERLLEEFRLVTADPFDGAPEPVVLADVVRDAIALCAHAGDVDAIPATLAGVDGAPPLLVERTALLQALLVLLPGASRVQVTVAGDFVSLAVHPARDAEAARAVAWLLRASGGHVDVEQTVFVPRLGTRSGRRAPA